jgi:hypothetical protein
VNCREFEERIHLWITAAGEANLDAAAREHLASCPRCARLLDLAAGGATVDLADGILARTTGGACSSHHERICAFVDGDDEGSTSVEQELVAEHLDHCAECSALAAALVWMKQSLPELAEIEPDVAFVSDVLDLTTRADREARRAAERGPRLAVAWGRLLRRPRIAQELAYLGAAILYLAVGPQATSVIRGDGEPRIARTNPVEAITGIVSGDPALAEPIRAAAGNLWDAAGAPVVDAGRDLLAEGSRGGSRLLQTARIAGRFLQEAGRASLSLDTVTIWKAASEAKSRVRECWKENPKRSGTEPPAEVLRTPRRTERSADPKLGISTTRGSAWRKS